MVNSRAISWNMWVFVCELLSPNNVAGVGSSTEAVLSSFILGVHILEIFILLKN